MPGLRVGALGRHHGDLEIPDVVELRRTEASRVESRERAGHVNAGDEIAARHACPFALTIGGELVARHCGGEKESDDCERDGDLALHSLSPSFNPPRTTQSTSLHSPRRTSFFSLEIEARGTSSALSSVSRRTITRAERPGRMRATSM